MSSSKTALVLPILPVAGVPDELIRVLNDRFRSLHLAVGAGEGPTIIRGTTGAPGGQGPPGPPGPGSGPGSPNVLPTSTAGVFYESAGSSQAFGFEGQIDLPTADPNFAAHFKRVDVLAIGSDGGAHLVQTFGADAIAAAGTSIAYRGQVGPQPLSQQMWGVAFQCYDELGTPTPSPFQIDGLAVYPAGITAVSGAEVPGSHFQDRLQGLHFVIELTVTTARLQSPVTVTFWVDYSDGNGWTWQGPFRIVGGTGSIRIGDPLPSSTGFEGNIWVPPPGREHWKVAAFPGSYDKTSVLPDGALTNTFDVTAVGLCTPHDITGAQFDQNPATGDILTYILHDPGVYNWGYYHLHYTQPTLAVSPWYWFSFVTIQKGHRTNGTCTIISGISLIVTAGQTLTAADVGKLIYISSGGERRIQTVADATHATLSASTANGAGQPFEIWNPAPVTDTDDEGIDQRPELYHGRWHAVSASFQGGVTSTPGTSVTYVGAKPPDWTFPLLNNPDGTVNINRQFRCWIYCGSHLNDLLPDGSYPPVPFVLQADCWPSAQDHFDLEPAAQVPALDLTVANPVTIKLPLSGGNGLPLTVEPGAIGSAYLGPQAVQAVNMAKDSITAANQALAANSVVDPNLVSVGINKVTYGTSIFAGDVVLSRGIGLPVIVLKNTGIFLYGQADASTGATGLTSKPYVAIQNNGIGLFQGGAGANPGGSVFLDAVNSAITIYSHNGDLTFPYFTVNATGLAMVNGPNSVAINTNAMAFVDTQFHNRLDMSSAGITLSNTTTNTKLVITSSAIQLQLNGSPRVTIDATSGITLSNGGTSSIVINATTASIINGTFHYATGGVTVDINPSISTPLGTANGMAIQSGGNAVVLTSSGVSVTTTGGSTGSFSATGISWSGPSGQASIGISPNQMFLQDGSGNAVRLTPTGLSFSITFGAFQTVIDSNLAWRHSVQCTDHIIGSDFGIAGVGFGVGTAGAPRTFTTVDGRTATVVGGIITALT